MDSLYVIKKLKPRMIYPGHGPVIENANEKINEYINHRVKRESEILAVIPNNIENALSISEIVDKVYQVNVIYN